MSIAVEKIDELAREMREYSRHNFGAKHGDDFVQIARAFMASKAGDALLKGVSIVGALNAILLPANPTATIEEKKRMVEDLLFGPENPLREAIAEIFYLGYRCGKVDAEVASLDRLVSNGTK